MHRAEASNTRTPFIVISPPGGKVQSTATQHFQHSQSFPPTLPLSSIREEGEESKRKQKKHIIHSFMSPRYRSSNSHIIRGDGNRTPQETCTFEISSEILNLHLTPGTPPSEWRKSFKREISTKTKEQVPILSLSPRSKGPSKKVLKDIVYTVYTTALKFTTIPLRVSQAVTVLIGVTKNKFFSEFINCDSPKKFWFAYQNLNSAQQQQIKCIIGGDEAHRFLEDMSEEKKVCKKSCTRSKSIFRIEKTLSSLKANPTHFAVGFEFFPIFLISGNGILESFRNASYYYNDLSDSFFTLNEKKLPLPEIDRECSVAERPVLFLAHLIDCLQKSLGREDLPNPLQQAQLLQLESIELLKVMDNHLLETSGLSEKETTRRQLTQLCEKVLESSFKGIESQETNEEKLNYFGRMFRCTIGDEGREETPAEQLFLKTIHEGREWFWKNLTNEENYKKEKWENVAEHMVDTLYIKMLAYPLLKQTIPLLSLLQALSFGAAAPSDNFMRKKLCRKLFKPKEGAIMLKWSYENATRFDIQLEQDGAFKVTQIKKYDLKQKQRIRGEALVHWSLEGGLNSKQYKAAHQFREFLFAEGTLLRTQNKVVSCFNLGKTESNLPEEKEKN